MSSLGFLKQLQNSGINLWLEGNTLLYEGPADAITPDNIEKLKNHKAEIIELLQREKPTKAQGYGCAGCGNKIYQAVQEWAVSELPATSLWTHEHKPVTHRKCEVCGAIFSIIGGTRGPELIQ